MLDYRTPQRVQLIFIRDDIDSDVRQHIIHVVPFWHGRYDIVLIIDLAEHGHYREYIIIVQLDVCLSSLLRGKVGACNSSYPKRCLSTNLPRNCPQALFGSARSLCRRHRDGRRRNAIVPHDDVGAFPIVDTPFHLPSPILHEARDISLQWLSFGPDRAGCAGDRVGGQHIFGGLYIGRRRRGRPHVGGHAGGRVGGHDGGHVGLRLSDGHAGHSGRSALQLRWRENMRKMTEESTVGDILLLYNAHTIAMPHLSGSCKVLLHLVLRSRALTRLELIQIPTADRQASLVIIHTPLEIVDVVRTHARSLVLRVHDGVALCVL